MVVALDVEQCVAYSSTIVVTSCSLFVSAFERQMAYFIANAIITRTIVVVSHALDYKPYLDGA